MTQPIFYIEVDFCLAVVFTKMLLSLEKKEPSYTTDGKVN
jgi:hypothetical protein